MHKLKLNSKGDLTLEFVAHMLTFLILAVFIVDLTVIGFRHNLALNCAYKIAKTMAVQSGVDKGDAPSHYYKFKSRYVDLEEFTKLVSDSFNKQVGAENYTIEVVHKNGLGQIIKTVDLTSGSNGITMDYGDLFDVKVNYSIPMTLTNNVLVGTYHSNGSVVVSSICEYKDYLK